MMFLCNKNTIKDFYDNFKEGWLHAPVYLTGYNKLNNEYLSKDLGNCSIGFNAKNLNPDIIPQMSFFDLMKNIIELVIFFIIWIALLCIAIIVLGMEDMVNRFNNQQPTTNNDMIQQLTVWITFFCVFLILVLLINSNYMIFKNEKLLNKMVVLVALNREFIKNEKNHKSNEKLIKIVNMIMDNLSENEFKTNEIIELLKNPEKFLKFCKTDLNINDYKIIKTIINK